MDIHLNAGVEKDTSTSILFQPLVSIIIPVYNGSKYVEEAIDSALAQEYQNIEIIVINDGSNDEGKTEAILKRYGSKIHYYSKENGGCGSALNLGIKKMKGKYFSWLSHDDKYLPSKISHQIDILSRLENKDTMIYGGYQLIDGESKYITTVQPDRIHPIEKLNISLFPLLRGLIHGCSLLIPAQYFSKVGLFDETLPSTQDYALWFDILRVAPIYYDDKVLIQSRQHPEQGTHTIPNLIDENNALWSGFLKKLTHQEMSEMEGAPILFLKKTGDFLKATPFKKAEELAYAMLHDLLQDIKVSVIMPFHNRVSLTIEAVKSVLGQTHTIFELILIDDGSTEDISSLLSLIEGDSRVIYLKQAQTGPGKARNKGILQASGDYIAFLDSDDLFYSNKLAEQLEFMKVNELVFSHTSYDRQHVERGPEYDFVNSGTLSGHVFPKIISQCTIAMSTVMGKAELFKEHLFPEYITIGEDVCSWITISSQYELGGIVTPLSKIRVDNNTAAYNSKKQAIGLMNISSFVLELDELSHHNERVGKLLRIASNLIAPYEEDMAKTKVSFMMRHIDSLERLKQIPRILKRKVIHSVKHRIVNIL